MKLTTPVALLIFNRPELTQKVFERVKEVKPSKLLIVADGARFPEEEEKCQQTRSVILDNIDWDCEVLTNFSDINLGCKKRVSSGLDWVFSQVEEAIILEDDCLPTLSFFSFCEQLLEYYRDDKRIMLISGNNFQDNSKVIDYSYYCSKYNHIWGWASWRRAWQYYDGQMKTYEEFKQKNLISLICEDSYEQNYWLDIFEKVYQEKIDTWDYQWTYACWIQNGLSILPQYNLVSNIGFGGDATHTTSVDSKQANLSTPDIWEIKHPPFVIRDREKDKYTSENIFGSSRKTEQTKTNKSFFNNFAQVLRKIKSKFKVIFYKFFGIGSFKELIRK